MTITHLPTLSEVVDSILAGNCDENLEAITGAVNDRRKRAARVEFLTCKPGDTGRLKNLRPKYMVGAPVTVVRKNQTRIVVTVDKEWLDRNGGERFRGTVTVQADMIDFD